MGVEAVLDDAFSRGSFESVVDGWLMPALVEVGTAWHQGRLGVAGEYQCRTQPVPLQGNAADVKGERRASGAVTVPAK